MKVTQDSLAAFSDARYLFLRHIEEPSENSLLLLIQEGAERPGPTESRLIAGVELFDLRVVESNDQSQLFELRWETYVAYSLFNESYARRDESSVCEGRLFQICTNSTYLDFVARSTFATPDYPGAIIHVRLHCENHTIDVASTDLPLLTRRRK